MTKPLKCRTLLLCDPHFPAVMNSWLSGGGHTKYTKETYLGDANTRDTFSGASPSTLLFIMLVLTSHKLSCWVGWLWVYMIKAKGLAEGRHTCWSNPSNGAWNTCKTIIPFGPEPAIPCPATSSLHQTTYRQSIYGVRKMGCCLDLDQYLFPVYYHYVFYISTN